MLTKKDFEAIAQILRDHEANVFIREAFAEFCQGQNPRFDYQRFFKACADDER